MLSDKMKTGSVFMERLSECKRPWIERHPRSQRWSSWSLRRSTKRLQWGYLKVSIIIGAYPDLSGAWTAHHILKSMF